MDKNIVELNEQINPTTSASERQFSFNSNFGLLQEENLKEIVYSNIEEFSTDNDPFKVLN